MWTFYSALLLCMSDVMVWWTRWELLRDTDIWEHSHFVPHGHDFDILQSLVAKQVKLLKFRIFSGRGEHNLSLKTTSFPVIFLWALQNAYIHLYLPISIFNTTRCVSQNSHIETQSSIWWHLDVGPLEGD